MSASTSRRPRGGTPHFACTAASSSHTSSPPRPPGASTVMFGETSCCRSLSLVTSTTSMPSAAARFASVAMTSSASVPGTSITGRPNARATSWICGSWRRRSSGIGGRCAL
jgi:hypothetical protein